MSDSIDEVDPKLAQFGCCACLWTLAIIAAIPIGYGLLDHTEAILNDEEFQTNCIDLYDSKVTIEPPNNLEFDVLEGFVLTMTCVMIYSCCIAFCCKDSDNMQTKTSCAGCLFLLSAFGMAAISLHIFLYINTLNQEFEDLSPLTCYVDDEWVRAHDWASAGVTVAISIIVSFSCIVYLLPGAMAAGSAVTSDTNTTQAPSTNNNNNNNPVNDIRTIAIRGDNNKNNNDNNETQLASQEVKKLIDGLKSLLIIDKLGFSIATTLNKTLLLEVLKVIEPSGQTALRDAIALSIVQMIALKLRLDELDVIGHQFIHVVLTDGADNSSKCGLTDIQEMYQAIGSSIGSRYFKTYFIGIDLGFQEQRDLQSIADLAGDAAELHNCNEVQLSDVFDRIKISLGIERRVALVSCGSTIAAASNDRVYLQAERQKFLVLFDLDMSASMTGNRWRNLQNALSSFFSGLDDSDIIGCWLFNDGVQCITGEVLTNALYGTK